MISGPAITLVHLPTVTSTMDVMDDLITAGTPEWTVVLADVQTAGLGRAGRRWEAEPGTALLCSVLVRPVAGSLAGGMLAIGAGVAVAAMLDDLGVAVQLKWPNDVLLGGRKLGGVLIRSRTDADGIAVNVGIGVNLRPTASAPAGRASLSEVLSTIPTLADLLPSLVGHMHQAVHRQNASDVRDAWLQRAALRDDVVAVEIDGARVVGRMSGLDADGALLLDTGQEAPRRVVAGDVVRGPRVEAG